MMTILLDGRALASSRPFSWVLTALVFAVGMTTILAEPKIVGPFNEGVPGSGYGCDNTCDGGDVNYVIRANLKDYTVVGSRNAPGFITTDPGNVDVITFTRTFEGDASASSPFCYDDDGTKGPLNPCLMVAPNQTMYIKIINEMDNGMDRLFQQLSPLAIMNSYPKSNFSSAQQGLNFTSLENTPGLDVTFDETNIHLHGMQVVPHLFFPQGTADPESEWITITPSNRLDGNQTCFCYVFEIPEDHPQGTFFWHIHRHGSASMQAWAGMAGILQVGNVNTTGSPENDLMRQGVDHHQPLVLWEWASASDNSELGENNTYYEGPFLVSNTNTFMTFMANNEYQPTFDMTVNETMHVPLVCAQTSTGSALYIADESGATFPFWVFAADGISYDKAYKKEMIVVGPGQREAMLLQFWQPGNYRIMQYLMNDAFNFTNGAETPVAFIQVSYPSGSDTVGDAINIDALTFTPGMVGQYIKDSEIEHQAELVFNIDLNNSNIDVPFPVFTIDNQPFAEDGVRQNLTAVSAAQWNLTSQLGFHPFHIHVNPFQIKEVDYVDTNNITVGNMSLQDAIISTLMEPSNMWRDTAFIPPHTANGTNKGLTRMYQRFSGKDIAWTGKSVFHCHFLDHEDQGMMGVMMIVEPDASSPGLVPSASPVDAPAEIVLPEAPDVGSPGLVPSASPVDTSAENVPTQAPDPGLVPSTSPVDAPAENVPTQAPDPGLVPSTSPVDAPAENVPTQAPAETASSASSKNLIVLMVLSLISPLFT